MSPRITLAWRHACAMGGALVVSACMADDGPLQPERCVKPIVSRSTVSANVNNVLSAFVTTDVQYADSVALRFGRGDASLDSATPAVHARDNFAMLAALGLHPRTAYRAQVVAFNACATTHGGMLAFETEDLPRDIATYVAAGVSPSPGYTAFAAGSYGLVIDHTGRVVWYHRFPRGPGLNFQPQPNGRFVARPSAAPGEPAKFVEIDPEGSATRTLGCAGGLQPRMHDMIAERDGSYWLMCDEVRTLDLSAQGGSRQASVLGTAVQRLGASGELLFSWSAFDHLDVDLSVLEPADVAVTPINWTHGNALDLDASGDLLISFRNLSEVTKVDTRTGAVVWRMGGARNQFTFENVSAPPFARQHGVRVNGDGKLVLLDNLGEPLESRVELYQFDQSRRVARLVRSHTSPAKLIAWLGGTTQALPNDHTLVSFGSGAGVEEYDAQGNVVWKLQGNPGYVFRAHRIRSLYQPGVGDAR